MQSWRFGCLLRAWCHSDDLVERMKFFKMVFHLNWILSIVTQRRSAIFWCQLVVAEYETWVFHFGKVWRKHLLIQPVIRFTWHTAEDRKARANLGLFISLSDMWLFSFQHGMTALIWASGRGHTEVVDHLLEAGANPDAADKVHRWL